VNKKIPTLIKDKL